MARKFNLMTGKWDEVGSSTGAVTNATFITVNAEPTLPNSRQLAAGNGIVLMDSGPGGTETISVSDLYDPLLTMGG